MKRVLLIIVLVLLAGYLLTGVAEVRPGERAVIRRFGRVLAEKPGPGLHVGLPWGMDRVDRVPVDMLRRVSVGYQPDEKQGDFRAPVGQLLTGDLNLVNIQVVLVYSVIEDQVEDYVVQADSVDSLVERVAETALAEWVAGRTVDDVLLRGKSTLPPWLVEQTRRRLEAYRLGIQIRDEASVAYLYPPDDVRDAFDKVNRAQAAIRTQINEASQQADRRVSEAESDRYRVEQLVAAYAQEQKLLADADARTFEDRRLQYHELRRKNPGFLTGIWYAEIGRLFMTMGQNGRLDLLDNHLGSDGLDIMQFPPLPRKK